MKHAKILTLLAFTLMCFIAQWLPASPYFLIDSQIEWEEALVPISPDDNRILEGTDIDWQEFMNQRDLFLIDGERIPPSQFLPPDLYVFSGDPGNPDYPDEPGLVMAWGEDNLPEDDYTSGWILEYGVDPDLTNCTIQLQVHPPVGITMVAFGLTDLEGDQCSWTWNVPANIPNSPPATTITINTNDIPSQGINSSNPACAAFSCNPNFDINKIVSIFINETFHNTPGVFPPPAPGGGSLKFYWNAWDEFVVKPNTGGSNGVVNTKSFIKYSQPPVETEDGMILGWDEYSVLSPYGETIMADDWKCEDQRPVTDIHWWGSFINWTQPYPPASQMPVAFHIGIWTDVPADVDKEYSHPGVLVWENRCDSYVWNFAGYDLDPRGQIDNEACFQFNQLLSQDEWFRQEPNPDGIPNIYWLSIAAIYNPEQQIESYWGWKTRKHIFNDDAIRIYQVDHQDGTFWPPNPIFTVGQSKYVDGQPVEFPDGESWDLAFEITTNEPGYEDNPIPGDINTDGTVNLVDFSILAANWLVTK